MIVDALDVHHLVFTLVCVGDEGQVFRGCWPRLVAIIGSDPEVFEHHGGRVAAGGTILALIELELMIAIAVVPAGEDDAHAGCSRLFEGLEIFTALLLHRDGPAILGERCSEAPESLVAVFSEELSPDIEVSVGVDEETAWTVGINAVFILALLLHADNTLRDGITGAVGARISLGLKPVQVCLHQVDALALRHSVLVDLSAGSVVGINEVDTSYTSALLTGHVHVERERAAESVLGLPDTCVIRALPLPHPKAVVAANCDLVAGRLCV